MKHLNIVIAMLLFGLFPIGTSCQGKQKTGEAKEAKAKVKTTLYDKTLPEIKALVNGRWELVSSKNAREVGEYEKTFITFDDDNYIWSEDGKDEPGALNWREADTKEGYKAYLMDAFLETSPSYPLAINGDTLTIQDCTETAYEYTLVRR